jgi:magnesium chelatase subunit I
VQDLIRTAVGRIYDRYFAEEDTQQIEQWFNLGGTVKLDDNQPAADALRDLKQIQGLFEKLTPLGVKTSDPAPRLVTAAEFLLEGMVAHRKLSRSQEHGFAAQEGRRRQDREERTPERQELESEYEDWQRSRRGRRGGLN